MRAKKRKPVEQPVLAIQAVCPKVHRDAPSGCRVCLKEVSEWKQIVHNGELYKPEHREVLDNTKSTIVFDPWVSIGHYRKGSYTTWNPIFNDWRVYAAYCYECWSQYHDCIMIVDGNAYGGLHLVTNWTNETNIKVQRTSGEIQEGNTFFTSLWNFKDVPETEKTQEDKERELEKIVYACFNYALGEFCLFVSLTKDGAHKAVAVSQIMRSALSHRLRLWRHLS